MAWEMRIGGDWIVPHLNGVIYTHKPPLLFWLINYVWGATGRSETAARLVGPAFGMAAIGATGMLGRRLWPSIRGIGGRSAIALAVFALFAGLTMFDAMLTLAVVLGVLTLTRVGTDRWAWLWFGAALALGVYSKGPVILVHLIPMALSLPLWSERRFGEVLRGLAVAGATGLFLVALWLVPAIVLGGPEYRDAVLWQQSAGRVSSAMGQARTAWFLVALLPLPLWPWGWLAACWRGLTEVFRGGDRGMRLCAIWFLSALVLFSFIGGKQIHDLLPPLPAAAKLFARAGTGGRIPATAIVPALTGPALLAVALGFSPDAGLESLADLFRPSRCWARRCWRWRPRLYGFVAARSRRWTWGRFSRSIWSSPSALRDGRKIPV